VFVLVIDSFVSNLTSCYVTLSWPGVFGVKLCLCSSIINVYGKKVLEL